MLAPFRPGDAIQAMKAQGMPFDDAGVFEILARVAHANAFHDGARPQISNRREGYDLRKRQPFEGDA